MKIQILLFISILTTFLISNDCKDNPKITQTNSQEKTDGTKILSINSEIKIDMIESLDSSKRVLKLICLTSQCYSCCNYYINNTCNISTENIDINFNNILVPTICLTQPGPAKATIRVGTLSVGTYNLGIKVGNNKISGKLIVTADAYKIMLDKSNDVKVISSILLRVPQNTIWGGIGYHIKQSDSLAQSFIDSLKYYGAIFQKLQVGNYGHFVIDSTGQIIDKNHGYYFHKPFILKYPNSISILKGLVNNYGAKYNSILNIMLYSSQGDIYRSWSRPSK